ncbi:primosomal protein [Pseudonocardia sp. KRD291]|uniref:primosomal protein n=1 Tax=Pseudonocardia sp. KRD291 TaxID=2792007 RepID=UPI001C49F79D|nr:primosomal protein [Pseudonocardia sp. KRD291]MBW0105155.1 primosomal protein [Pseudonocardia sp. KRD291]
MASDIVPIQLALTRGDVVTLWAPRWREDGEEWEAFLGDEEAVFGFDEVAGLAAYVRTAPEHDLTDHPAWSVVPTLSVGELTPDENHRFDIVGLPEVAAGEPDGWTIGELDETVAIVRSLAEVCDLDDVTRILDGEPGFDLLRRGAVAFAGREGAKQWTALSDTIGESWDAVLDALDELVATPEIDGPALERSRAEAVALAEAEEAAGDPDDDPDDDVDDAELEAEAHSQGATVDSPDEPEAPVGFWGEVGIDPIRIETSDGEVVTLRCYLDDKPVFLGSGGRIDVFGSERALVRALADPDGAVVAHTDLAAASTWQEVLDAAHVGELEATVEDMNTYVLTGVGEDLAEGVLDMDPVQLDLASELLLDVGEWAGDDEPANALAESSRLGWLVSFVVRPDPTRMAPSPPFGPEAAQWGELVATLRGRLRLH